ncbi:hypothetical protein [Rhizohabitans arisaemae]|uniref:hypothetical protein n=1 Tax=Rhizohabitans arisaemae TaxID=2720610 RepID=UPI0024B11181|nr:hypothetical protein [Rhizohabitans arisaemae]
MTEPVFRRLTTVTAAVAIGLAVFAPAAEARSAAPAVANVEIWSYYGPFDSIAECERTRREMVANGDMGVTRNCQYRDYPAPWLDGWYFPYIL